MGWGRTLFLGDVGNRLDIEDTERDIQQLKHRIANEQHNNASLEQTIRQLIKENAQTKLYLASIVRLLLSKGSITKQELEVMVNAIDAEDGKTDGMFHGNIV
jgi:transcriptional regulator CtsR